jgi:hypothetical protein
MKPLLIFLLPCLVSQAGVVARWEAGGAASGIELERGPSSPWTLQRSPYGPVAALEPARDYYRRAAFQIRLPGALPGSLWLVVEYVDEGFGLIGTEPGAPQARQWGVARLGTGKLRRAVFGYAEGGPGASIRLYGVTRLRALTLSDTEPEREPIPDVAPAVRLRRPVQLVTTAGADARTPEGLEEALATMRNLLPLVRALGFSGVESYVKWNFVERSPGVFDWSFYDAINDELDRHGLGWFPLLIAGSAYALPAWFHDSEDNAGFVCLEHGMRNDIQSIFCGLQDKYVKRFLAEFGRHYGRRKTLLGVRLGPSGNYGEAQYPARGDWGYQWGPIHTHIGYWAADPCAQRHFRDWLRRRYRSIEALNEAWGERYRSFEEITTFLPATALARRKRIDFADWYMGSMSLWCEQWAAWAREALPEAVIDQSSGGWGPIEIGTDYSFQARSMARLGGGIRLTNESDNFADNFAITRMASSAARFYGAPLGYEPGGFGSARGVIARLYNMLTNGGEHLFYYHANLVGNDQAIDRWLEAAPLLDDRARPVIDVAAFYPDTTIKLDDEPLRFRWGSVFLVKAQALRSALDYDFVSEQMIDDGALDRYRVLVFLWGYVTERRILERIDRWVQAGGTLIYPTQPRGLLETVEGDQSISRKWRQGETGKGRVIFYPGDPVPGEYYARFIRSELRRLGSLRPPIRRALEIEKPEFVYWSVLENGRLALLNFEDDEAHIRLAGGRSLRLPPYRIALVTD